MISKSSEKDVPKLECCDRNLCARCTRCRGPLPLPRKPAGQQARTSLQSASAQRKLEPTLVGQAKHSYVSEESCDTLENSIGVYCAIAGQSTSLLDRSLYRYCDLCEHHLLSQNPENSVMWATSRYRYSHSHETSIRSSAGGCLTHCYPLYADV